ncbi:response regulator transcription factor [Roseomonas sp. M0104]|uniref:Response regulator transcription factor n=1 Tax=Teichococcus coralli TaxID=2545983 RepID=A0A845BBM8_9PROT|nr:response regulator [Pseudoroseomonas coralli]MXP63494.1 response regulator transcription factor [Pseudoroseomonas coralli]
MGEARIAYVVDDEEVVRRSLVLLLRSAGYTVRAFPSGEDFLSASAEGLPFGCVLLDLRMPDLDGLSVQRRIVAQGLDMPVIVVTAHGDVPMAVEAMKLGASDFIEKPYDGEALLQAAGHALARGAEARARSREAAEAAERVAALTVRELEVLQGLVTGKQNKEIARDLGLSPRTVEIHRANVMEKLAVRSLPEAVRIALSAGLATRSMG